MPPKKATKKKKASSAKAEKSAEDAEMQGMSREQLEGQVMRLRDELDREREERNYFQLERDKINTFWEITKRQLEESRAEVRNKERDIEEAEDRHAVEIKVYKQKVKHLLYEHQNQITELKTDNVTDVKLAADSHRAEEAVLRKDKRHLKVELKEMELSHEEIIKSLQQEYDKQVTVLREDLQRQAKDMARKYEVRAEQLREQLDLRRKTEIHEIEERKNGQINTLMRNHEKAFTDIKNYYNDITLNNLALINALKDQIEDLKKKDERLEKQMGEVAAENKKLAEPLAKATSEVSDLRKALAMYERDKQALQTTKSRVKSQDEALSQLRWEHDVLQQRFTEVEKERDELYNQYVKSIHDVQQKSGLRNLLLEKKLGAVAGQLEKKEAQLNEVLAASNLDPTALSVVTRKLEDVLDSKNQAVKDLQYELARVAKAHNDMLQAYDAKLREFGIPTDELGFKPVNLGPSVTLGKGPAGLTTS
eukprot:m.16222 g.16222  ORF g.16222 m.16222 type:complete len:479 (-) comp8868_c0_seq1:93-1529(-)